MPSEMPFPDLMSAVSLTYLRRDRSYPSPDWSKHPENESFDWEWAPICPNLGQIPDSKLSIITAPADEGTMTGRSKVGANRLGMHVGTFLFDGSASPPWWKHRELERSQIGVLELVCSPHEMKRVIPPGPEMDGNIWKFASFKSIEIAQSFVLW